ncbi:MAG: FHA domain-containing protein [Phycisphaerae bacterium]
MGEYRIELSCEGQEVLSETTTKSAITLGSHPACDVVTWPDRDLPPRWLRLRFEDVGFALVPESEQLGGEYSVTEASECAFGTWIEIADCRLRVTQVDGEEARIESAGPIHDSAWPGSVSDKPSSASGVQFFWSEPEVEILTSDGVRLRFTFPGENCEVIIGRKRQGTDLVIARDRYISARHLRLFRSGRRPTVEDLNSKQGTLLNGTRITRPMRLTHGDEVQFGQSVMRYVCYRDILRSDEVEEQEAQEQAAAAKGGTHEAAASLEPSRAPGSEAVAIPPTTHEGAEQTELMDEEEPKSEPPTMGEAAPSRRRSFWSMERGGGILLILAVILGFVLLVWSVLSSR